MDSPQGRQKVLADLAELRLRIGELDRTREAIEKAWKSLIQGRAVLEGIFQYAPDAVLVVDQERRIAAVNREAELLFGYTEEELLGQRHDILVPERFGTVHAEHMKGYMDSPRVRFMGIGMELFGRRKDGSEFPAEIALGPVETLDGLYVLAIVRDVTDRKLLQQALGDSEERYRQLVENLPESVAVLSDGNVVFCNSACARLYGVESLDQIIGKPALGFIHPDDRMIAGERIRKVMDERVTVPLIEEKFLKFDGSVIDVEVISTPYTHQGQPAVQTILRDVTERKRIQRALQESEERYRNVVELSPDSITVQTGGRFVFANSAAARLFGFSSPQDLLGRPVMDLVHPDSRGIVAERIRRLLEEGRPLPRAEVKLLRLDGSTVEAEVVSMPFAFNAEKGTLAILRDITDRKRTERALQESEERYRTLVQMSPDIVAVSTEGRLVFLNPAGAVLYGVASPEELYGRPVLELMHPDYRPIVQERLRQLQEERRPVPLIEEKVLRADGTTVDVEAISVPFNYKGSPASLSVVRDISHHKRTENDLRQAMEDLERSNRDLEQFAYAASHDLQEPLRMVTSFTQLLDKRYRGKLDKDADEFIGFIVDGATRMQVMINDLLDYSRVGTRGEPFQETDLEEVFRQATANLIPAISESAAIVTHDRLPTALADDAQMVRLFQNLIGNAIKFRSEERPRVHVSSQGSDGDWVVSVRDNGIGIAPEFFDKLFVIFQRLHTREEYPGTGVGLAICKKIVNRHGGRIWVESEPGKGSTFFFTIPKAG